MDFRFKQGVIYIWMFDRQGDAFKCLNMNIESINEDYSKQGYKFKTKHAVMDKNSCEEVFKKMSSIDLILIDFDSEGDEGRDLIQSIRHREKAIKAKVKVPIVGVSKRV